MMNQRAVNAIYKKVLSDRVIKYHPIETISISVKVGGIIVEKNITCGEK